MHQKRSVFYRLVANGQIVQGKLLNIVSGKFGRPGIVDVIRDFHGGVRGRNTADSFCLAALTLSQSLQLHGIQVVHTHGMHNGLRMLLNGFGCRIRRRAPFSQVFRLIVGVVALASGEYHQIEHRAILVIFLSDAVQYLYYASAQVGSPALIGKRIQNALQRLPIPEAGSNLFCVLHGDHRHSQILGSLAHQILGKQQQVILVPFHGNGSIHQERNLRRALRPDGPERLPGLPLVLTHAQRQLASIRNLSIKMNKREDFVAGTVGGEHLRLLILDHLHTQLIREYNRGKLNQQKQRKQRSNQLMFHVVFPPLILPP